MDLSIFESNENLIGLASVERWLDFHHGSQEVEFRPARSGRFRVRSREACKIVRFTCSFPMTESRTTPPFDPFAWISQELNSLDAARLRRDRRIVEPLPEGRCRIDSREYWNFAGNDYLDLAGAPRVKGAAIAAVEDAGVGSRASALVTGYTPWHAALEAKLASFKRADAAILFPTGYAANVGTIAALAGQGDVVFCDRLNHASLVDGCRLSGAKLRVYPHRDLDKLASELTKARDFPRRLIVTDTLFSMDGTQAPLEELVGLAEIHNAILLADEAHATGLYGDRGTGLVEANQIPCSRVVSVGTLSKALGAQGGFVTGSQPLIDWLWNSSRTQMFSTALAPAMCAAATAAIEIVEQEPQRRWWLRDAWRRTINTLREQGWTIPQNVDSPIIPVLVQEPDTVLRLRDELQWRGIYVAAIRPPTVPHNTSRLRISLSYAHGDLGIDALLSAFAEIPPKRGRA